MRDSTTNYYHEIIKVPDNSIAWIYTHLQNDIVDVTSHWHRDLEITYILEGSVHYYINGHSRIFTKKDIVLINDGTVHSCVLDITQKSDALNIIFPYDFITQFQNNTGSVFFNLEEESPMYPQLQELFSSLYHCIQKKNTDPYYQLEVNHYLYKIASLLFHHFLAPEFQSGNFISERYKIRCQEIVRYIDLHYSENLTLESVSDRVHISKEHLSRTFREYMGINFKKYLTQIRMVHAYQDLISTDLTLLEISLNNGFTDSRAFIHNFKRVYGTTPLKYRKIKESLKDTLSNPKSKFLCNQGDL